MLKILKYEFWPYKCVAMGHSIHFKFDKQINNSKYYPMDENYPQGIHGYMSTF